MSTEQLSEKEIFNVARRLDSLDAVAEYLGQVCSDDAPLRARIQQLLKDDQADSFLEQPAVAPGDTIDTSQPMEKEGQSIGRYKLLQQIGEGGFGVVFMAEQQRPVRRKVALKVIKPGMDTKEVIARFEAERQALAMMDHPNIAKVLDAGETESGRPFFAMELVKGVPLTEFCDSNKLSTPERLELFVTVCRAIQHAHHKGIIHRDLKPSNVMITLDENRPVPKVIDFGVSKAISHQLTERTLFTAYGQMVGTPVYMSPEQAQMSGIDIDTRSDIYSLGVILYELLTGTTPLDAERLRKTAYIEMQRLIAEEDAPKPSTRITTLGKQTAKIAQYRGTDARKLKQFLLGDLDWIVMKALDKERSRRYESASSFADDVERFLSDDAIEARPPSAAYRFQKFARRHRAVLSTVTAIAAVLVIAAVVSTSLAVRAIKAEADTLAALDEKTLQEAEAQKQKDAALTAQLDAEAAQRQAESIAERNRRLLYASNMLAADQISQTIYGGQQKVEELLAAWIPTDSQGDPHASDLREFAWRYQWTRLHFSAINSVLECDAAGISQSGHLVTANKTGVRVWDDGGALLDHVWKKDASQAQLSPNGRWAAIPDTDEVKLIELNSGRVNQRLRGNRCCFSANGELIATWGGQDGMGVWNAATGEHVTSLESHAEIGLPVNPNQRSLSLAPNGRSLLLTGHPRHFIATAFMDGRSDPVVYRNRNGVGGGSWSPDGRLIANGTATGRLLLHRTSDPGQATVTGSHGTPTSTTSFSPDSTRLASGGHDGTIDIWDVATVLASNSASYGQTESSVDDGEGVLLEVADQSQRPPGLIQSLQAHMSRIQSLVFSKDGTKLVSLDSGGVAKLFHLGGDQNAYSVENMAEDRFGGSPGLNIVSTTFEEGLKDGITIAGVVPGSAADRSGKIRKGDRLIAISDGRTGEMIDVRELHVREGVELMYGPFRSSVKFKFQRDDSEPTVVELERDEKRYPRSFTVAFAPDGRSIAVADQWIGAATWDFDGKGRRFPARDESLAFSPDGRFLALSNDPKVLLWDRKNDRLFDTLEGGGFLAFSPDGKYLAAGRGYPYNSSPIDAKLRVWKIPAREEIGSPLFTGTRVICSVGFTPDGNWMLGADHSGAVRIWSTSTWKLERTLQVGEYVVTMAVSPDGQTLAFGSQPHGIVLWDFASGTQLRALRGHTAWGLAFSPNGRTLASTGRDSTAVLWDVESGRQLRTFYGHTDAVCGVAFSPDGNTLATSGTDGVLRLWKASTFEEIERHPLTLRSMRSLGAVHNKQERYAKAETILRRTLSLQAETLPSDHPELLRTRSEIANTLRGQNRWPVFTRQPQNVAVALGEPANLEVAVDGKGPWALQWFFAGKPVEGATGTSLEIPVVREEHLGAYHVQVQPVEPDPAIGAMQSSVALLFEERSPNVGRRGLHREVYLDLPTNSLGNFASEPDIRDTVDLFETPRDVADDYGTRLTGFLVPPITGDYVFYLCSDDQGELSLSTDESSENKRPIASVDGWAKYRQWEELSEQSVSTPVRLEQGRRYWLEAVFREGMGEDHLSVTWQVPGGLPPRNGDPPIPGDFLEHDRRQ